jgi:hypothetical protein
MSLRGASGSSGCAARAPARRRHRLDGLLRLRRQRHAVEVRALRPAWNAASTAVHTLLLTFRISLQLVGSLLMTSETSFASFLRAFTEDWATRMSGPLGVPLTIAAAYLSPSAYKTSLAGLAGVCAFVAAYGVWRNERLHGISVEGELKALKEALALIPKPNDVVPSPQLRTSAPQNALAPPVVVTTQPIGSTPNGQAPS